MMRSIASGFIKGGVENGEWNSKIKSRIEGRQLKFACDDRLSIAGFAVKGCEGSWADNLRKNVGNVYLSLWYYRAASGTHTKI